MPEGERLQLVLQVSTITMNAYLSIPFIGAVYARRDTRNPASWPFEVLNHGVGPVAYIGKWEFTFDEGQSARWLPLLIFLSTVKAIVEAAFYGSLYIMRRGMMALFSRLGYPLPARAVQATFGQSEGTGK
ncbi:hypothetical protein BA190_24020 [Labrys sp. WJW]|uniref:hypothetical protein n=1 Tax=Labrys sp. WJW TaxID=1737983 RepID=UPI00082ADFAB|nr:hypothetical protein [Labrys sp. WJW]OCC02395.1 hypothetical protein BA190_24020 [Labrys sp. WJW]